MLLTLSFILVIGLSFSLFLKLNYKFKMLSADSFNVTILQITIFAFYTVVFTLMWLYIRKDYNSHINELTAYAFILSGTALLTIATWYLGYMQASNSKNLIIKNNNFAMLPAYSLMAVTAFFMSTIIWGIIAFIFSIRKILSLFELKPIKG